MKSNNLPTNPKLAAILKRRAKWVKALRSGKYKQTQRRLCHEGKYCCLGVADRVCRLKDGGGFGITMNQMLTDAGKDKLGLTGAQATTLAQANDNKGKNFAQIADIIEKMPIRKAVLK